MDLEHGKLKLQIEGLQADLSSRFNIITHEVKKSNELTEKVLAQAIKTNGRVTKLEDKVEKVDAKVEQLDAKVKKDLEFIDLLRRKKWIIGILFMAFMYSYEHFDINKILKIFGI